MACIDFDFSMRIQFFGFAHKTSDQIIMNLFIFCFSYISISMNLGFSHSTDDFVFLAVAIGGKTFVQNAQKRNTENTHTIRSTRLRKTERRSREITVPALFTH